MPWKMHDQEFATVSSLPAGERYAYMIARMADREEVWGLRNASGWVVTADDDRRQGLPVWPHPRFAEVCATGAWAGSAPSPITLDDWMKKWLPGLERDRRFIVAFALPGGSTKGVVIEPAEHRDHLLAELDNLGDTGGDEQ